MLYYFKDSLSFTKGIREEHGKKPTFVLGEGSWLHKNTVLRNVENFVLGKRH